MRPACPALEDFVATKLDKAVRWYETHPDASSSDCVRAGFSKSTAYLAHRIARQHTALAKVEPKPEDPLLQLVKNLHERGVVELHLAKNELHYLAWRTVRLEEVDESERDHEASIALDTRAQAAHSKGT